MSAAVLRRIPVVVVLPPQTLLLDVAGPAEVLRKANLEQADVRFDLRYVGPAPAVTSSVGLTLSGIEPLPGSLPDDAIVMVSGDTQVVLQAGDRPVIEGSDVETAAIVDWLRRKVKPGHTLISICSGALLSARAGLLDGHLCTTHHEDCAALAALAPRARVVANRLFVEDGDRLTSAGIAAGIDLMLHVVGRIVGPACALAVARYMVVYLRRSGADPQLSPWLEGRNHIHPAVHRAQDAIAADPARAWTLAALGAIACASPRHLSRLFNEHAGMSIPDYLNRLRVALAQELLRQTRLDIEAVAERSGFASSRQFRRAWGRLNAVTPSHARGAA